MASGVNTATRKIDFTPRPGDRRLEIGIIGAGIAGLGAAIALGQAGHDVEVGSSLISVPLALETIADHSVQENADIETTCVGL
jgi:3-hydroxyisobutyrate dehydrogenase-like beta-hydroxyacid dehydrogenase